MRAAAAAAEEEAHLKSPWLPRSAKSPCDHARKGERREKISPPRSHATVIGRDNPRTRGSVRQGL